MSRVLKITVDGIKFSLTRNPLEVWRHMNSENCLPFFQFVKYGLCGFAALSSNLFVVIILSYFFIPAMGDWAYQLSDATREKNLIINNFIAFPIGNFVAYFTNVLWVFEGGRHSRLVEFGIFTGISAISFLAGLFAGPALIENFSMPSWMAQGTFVLASILVNFICRKFLVFKN